MPARTVVIDKLTRFTGENHVPLKPSDFTQLTGRAGRRGIDDLGHAVTLWSPFVGFDEVCRFALNKSFNLTSAFRPTYNMTVNLVNSHSEGEVRHLLNLSFAQYQANSGVVTMQASIEKKREIYDYLNELTDIEKVGYTIAFNHLESSFDICRSNGFKEWKNSKASK